ncbi:hypothetical protein [Micromonospora carbonacea]|uniref:Uncharacterized protein n=1 Tax=Micromonospora carbonacea TaxID=47853 RepID=A0A1C5ACX3_9ACTN|nr:hypothetical protein [Micromonospora carbonacea]SCF42874.1 hypothetical protein GA0070563_112146 [Micromonospora carbonacea]
MTDPTITRMLTATWTAVSNDEIGGWAVTTDGRSPASGGVMAADMMWSREIAEHIADLHRRFLAGGVDLDVYADNMRLRRDLDTVTRDRDTLRDVARSNKRHNAVLAELVERVAKYADEVGGVHGERLRSLLSAPVAAERGIPAPEPTPNPAQANTAPPAEAQAPRLPRELSR